MEKQEAACRPDAQGSEVRYWGEMGKEGNSRHRDWISESQSAFGWEVDVRGRMIQDRV